MFVTGFETFVRAYINGEPGVEAWSKQPANGWATLVFPPIRHWRLLGTIFSESTHQPIYSTGLTSSFLLGH